MASEAKVLLVMVPDGHVVPQDLLAVQVYHCTVIQQQVDVHRADTGRITHRELLDGSNR